MAKLRIAKELFDILHPVKSLYISTDSTNPATLFGYGTWSQLTGDAYLKLVTSGAGSYGGVSDHKIKESHVPSHYHTRGTMNITGHFDCQWPDNSGGGNIFGIGAGSGALSPWFGNTHNRWSYATNEDDAGRATGFEFNAANGWSGQTSSYGQGNAYYPYYYGIYAWVRTA